MRRAGNGDTRWKVKSVIADGGDLVGFEIPSLDNQICSVCTFKLGGSESLEDLRRDDHHMYGAARSRNATPKGLNIHMSFTQPTIIFVALLEPFRLASGSWSMPDPGLIR